MRAGAAGSARSAAMTCTVRPCAAAQFGGERLQPVRAPRGEHQVEPVGGEHPRDRRADPRRRAGDQRRPLRRLRRVCHPESVTRLAAGGGRRSPTVCRGSPARESPRSSARPCRRARPGAAGSDAPGGALSDADWLTLNSTGRGDWFGTVERERAWAPAGDRRHRTAASRICRKLPASWSDETRCGRWRRRLGRRPCPIGRSRRWHRRCRTPTCGRPPSARPGARRAGRVGLRP